jgi:hypothetical protein
MIYAIVKDNYVIDRIIADEGYVYPYPHDFMKEDEEGHIYIGDWYEEAEDLFYRPVNGIPPDSPLQPSEIG